ncbi:glycoside hydrolase family 65 protein [Micromonospora sp. PPF5-17]|uniref:Glycoside hydrolase family 65 protein n=2 Tax=Micromonosporaceae TaxID=28056 RepID=A0ABX9WAL4_9ACTN|nr:glycoside hydrolase family 65 protein [Micromonospora sp. PPF5-17B]NES38919.1 glycoside hydrolase family 65 protein [Micromonospora solifontis]NES54738.1 glycoside hydrolase family 65 protein [Micromonospora sp. PPF5-6]RNL92580.1 glycoside hydrolase family 65 protein [Micromonospora solifontis]
MLALGNGYQMTRGAAPETVAGAVHYPATYVAGVYNRLVSHFAGRSQVDESLVRMPNWLPITFRHPDGPWFPDESFQIRHQHVALDLRRGLHRRDVSVRDTRGRRTRVRQERFVSMAHPHLSCLHTVITALNWSGPLQIRSLVDGRVSNSNVAEYAALARHHLTGIETGQGESHCWLTANTTQSQVRIALASRTSLAGDAEPASGRRPVTGTDHVGHELDLAMVCGTPVALDKTVSLYTSRDPAISAPLDAALVEIADAPAYPELRAAHTLAWKHLWRRFHLRLGGPGLVEQQRALNVHLFHVAQTLSGYTADADAGVPARGLHGEGYRGHVFWDELFVFPLLNLRTPDLTRALLLYRHRRLPQARRRARALGMAGALFPWQSGSDGREETPNWLHNPLSRRWMPDNSRRQYHVNLAIAYNVWQYYQVTGDVDFLAAYGAELLVDIARFWAALAEYDTATDRYHIRGVMGPDEFHDGYPERPGCGVDNNAYVNVMTAWMLARTADVYRALGGHHTDDLWQRLAVTDVELARWEHMSRRLYVPFLPNGLLSQFDGYAGLDTLDVGAYRDRYGDVGRLDLILEAEGSHPNRYQTSKQADVLMLLYLLSAEELTALLGHLGYQFDPGTIPATVHYYLARTTHGSTLSRVVHSWVLARTRRSASWQLLCDALAADLSDTASGTTGNGVHLGAMAGTADILQRCYTGLEARDDALRLHPQLPPALGHLDFNVGYRGHWLRCHCSHDVVSVEVLPSAAAPVTVILEEAAHVVSGGDRISVRTGGR